MDKVRAAMVLGVVAFIIGTAIVLNMVLRKDLGDGPADEEEDGLQYHELEVGIRDAFTTDRITSMVTPPLFTQVFLVLDLAVGNPLGVDIGFNVGYLILRTDRGNVSPSMMEQFIGRSLSPTENITAGSNVSGYVHFPVFPEDRLLGLEYRDSSFNVAISMDLLNLTVGSRPWKTPLTFGIVGCGRDPPGSGRERYLYFDLRVTDMGENASHFQCWLIDLECHNGVVLDGLFVEEPEDERFLPGWNVTYKVYFDIPIGSPERPKVLYQKGEGMRLEVSEDLYTDLV